MTTCYAPQIKHDISYTCRESSLFNCNFIGGNSSKFTWQIRHQLEWFQSRLRKYSLLLCHIFQDCYIPFIIIFLSVETELIFKSSKVNDIRILKKNIRNINNLTELVYFKLCNIYKIFFCLLYIYEKGEVNRKAFTVFCFQTVDHDPFRDPGVFSYKSFCLFSLLFFL